MRVWSAVIALVAVAASILIAAYFDPDLRVFLKDVGTVAAGTIILAAALISYQGATAKIDADRKDAAERAKKRREAFKAVLSTELLAIGWEAGRTRANAEYIASILPDEPRREIQTLRLRAPTFGTAEWQDLGQLDPDIARRYQQLIARIGQTNRFIDAVLHDAIPNYAATQISKPIASPFRSLAEDCGAIAKEADELAEAIRNL